MNRSLPEEWLARATRGLPAEVSQRVRQELLAHYEEAVADYEEEGATEMEARELALTTLGDSRSIGAALRESHLAKRRYLNAVLLGFFSPLLLPSLVLIWRIRLGDVVFSLFVLLPVIYLVRSFGLLLRENYRFYRAGLPLRLLNLGLGILSLSLLLVRIVFARPLVPTGATLTAYFFHGLTLVAVLLIAGGMVLLAEKLADLENNLYGLLLPLRLLFWLCGFSLFGTAVAFKLELAFFMALFSIPAIVSFVCIGALWTLLFFRVLYRPLVAV